MSEESTMIVDSIALQGSLPDIKCETDVKIVFFFFFFVGKM